MTISAADLLGLEQRVNATLSQHNAKFVMTVHFSAERLNDARNVPPLNLAELEDVFLRLIDQHIMSILVLNDEDTFNIRCSQSHINMPCAVQKTSSADSGVTHKNIIITVMRKKTFKAKDPVEFVVA